MPATFDWESDNGAATGSPAQGTTRNTGRTDNNWKNVDDASSSYSSSPITAGNNSYTVYMFGKFSGTFTQIQSGLWNNTSGDMGTGLTLMGVVTSTYATPATSTNSALTVNMSTHGLISAGQTVLFSGTGPQAASPASSTTSNPSYTQYLATQLTTTSSAAAGNTTTVTLTFQYLEN
jgi:hypothetical protein